MSKLAFFVAVVIFLNFRLEGSTPFSNPLPKLNILPETESVSTPESSAPPTPSSGVSFSRLNAAAKPPLLASYNGGMRGSTQDKKKFFEAAIARQTQSSPSTMRKEAPIKQKYGTTLSVSDGTQSESGTDISGYDSVAGDFCYNGFDRQNLNLYGQDNCWYSSRGSVDYSIDSKTPTLIDSG